MKGLIVHSHSKTSETAFKQATRSSRSIGEAISHVCSARVNLETVKRGHAPSPLELETFVSWVLADEVMRYSVELTRAGLDPQQVMTITSSVRDGALRAMMPERR